LLGFRGRIRLALRKLIASFAAGHVPALIKIWKISESVLIQSNLLICMDKSSAFCILVAHAVPRTIRFDSWVLHREVGDLIRGEEKVRLQDQPLQGADRGA